MRSEIRVFLGFVRITDASARITCACTLTHASRHGASSCERVYVIFLVLPGSSVVTSSFFNFFFI